MYTVKVVQLSGYSGAVKVIITAHNGEVYDNIGNLNSCMDWVADKVKQLNHERLHEVKNVIA